MIRKWNNTKKQRYTKLQQQKTKKRIHTTYHRFNIASLLMTELSELNGQFSATYLTMFASNMCQVNNTEHDWLIGFCLNAPFFQELLQVRLQLVRPVTLWNCCSRTFIGRTPLCQPINSIKNVIRSSVSQDAPVTKVWRKSVNRYWRYRGNIKLPRNHRRRDGRPENI